MKKQLLISFLLILGTNVSFSQNGLKYKMEGNLDSAMYALGMNFFQNPTDTENAYELSRTLALMGRVDTAFYFLEASAINDSTLLPLADSQLYFLSEHPKWKDFEDSQFKKYQEKHGALNKPEYAKQLIRMIQKDQAFDYHQHQAFSFYQENGRGPHWLYPILTIKGRNVQSNYKEMQRLIEREGWPTYKDVGQLAADAPLLIINHLPNNQIRSEFLPQIKEACLAGQGSCMEFAKIQDRILVSEGKPQEYGMQFRMNASRKREPFTIRDPETVDRRRRAIGLEPLADYLKRKINYNFTVKQK